MCKNKFYVCTYSTIRFTLRFVNLFLEIRRVCGVGPVKNGWDLKAMLRSEQTSKEKSLSKLDQFKQSWEIKVENSGA